MSSPILSSPRLNVISWTSYLQTFFTQEATMFCSKVPLKIVVPFHGANIDLAFGYC